MAVAEAFRAWGGLQHLSVRGGTVKLIEGADLV